MTDGARLASYKSCSVLMSHRGPYYKIGNIVIYCNLAIKHFPLSSMLSYVVLDMSNYMSEVLDVRCTTGC